MSTCPKCGQKIDSNLNKCPNCGNKLDNKDNQINSPQINTSNIRIRKFIPWAIFAFIIVLLIIVFVLVRNYNSPDAQTKILVNAIDNNDSQKVATLLSSKNSHIDSDEASVYIDYIRSEVGMKKFARDIKSTVETLNKSDSKEAINLKTRAGNNYLRVSKNGTRLLIFDNMSYTAPTKKAIVKPKLDTEYEFKENSYC